MDAWPDEPFTRSDLPRLGRTELDLRRGRRSGAVRPVVRGVFAATHLEDSIDLRVAALAKVVPRHHVVTDRSAAWLHGVDAHTYGEHDGVPPIEWCALRGHEPTTLRGADGRTRDLEPSDVMHLDGLRATTPLRTALDLGCCLRRREAFAAMCELARVHHFTSSRPDEGRAALPTPPGCGAAPWADSTRRRAVRVTARSVVLPGHRRCRHHYARATGVDRDRWRTDVPPRPRLPAAAGLRRVRRTRGSLVRRATGTRRARRRWLRDNGWTAISSARGASAATPWTRGWTSCGRARPDVLQPAVVTESPDSSVHKSRLNHPKLPIQRVRRRAPTRWWGRRCRRSRRGARRR